MATDRCARNEVASGQLATGIEKVDRLDRQMIGGTVATKDDFTPEEWSLLEYGVSDAMAYATLADPGFWDSFKEANASAHFIAGRRESPSTLVRDLVTHMKPKRDPEMAENPTAMGDEASERISQAYALVREKAPDEADAYKELVLGVARAAAGATGGVSQPEETALERIEAALA